MSYNEKLHTMKQKISIMKELCDRYEQLKFINDEATASIMGTYVDELEKKLVALLTSSENLN